MFSYNRNTPQYGNFRNSIRRNVQNVDLTQYLPMGRAKMGVKAMRSAFDPKLIQKATREFAKDILESRRQAAEAARIASEKAWMRNIAHQNLANETKRVNQNVLDMVRKRKASSRNFVESRAPKFRDDNLLQKFLKFMR